MQTLSWQIGLVKHAMWADSVYFLILLSISKFQHHPSLLYAPLHKYIGLILIFLEDPVRDCPCVHGTSRLEVSLFRHCGFCHIHGEYCRCCGSISGLLFMNTLSQRWNKKSLTTGAVSWPRPQPDIIRRRGSRTQHAQILTDTRAIARANRPLVPRGYVEATRKRATETDSNASQYSHRCQHRTAVSGNRCTL
jgi:hypothetical protein